MERNKIGRGNKMLIYAIIFINLACLLYTVGVWAERLQKNLKLWHIVMLWGGFVFDIIGTAIMTRIAGGVFKFDFHGVTGLAAIFLMLILAAWATIATIKKDEEMKNRFHKFSIIVWFIWLIPMVSAIVMGMAH